MKARPVLQLCGLGTQPPEETTLEVLEALERSRLVYLEPEDSALRRWLDPWCRQIRPTSALGADDGERSEAILQGLEGVVSVAVWGHPLLTSGLGLELARRARSRGVELVVPGAVSPIGSAFAKASAFFGGDYGYHGIQACSVEEALAGRMELDASLPVVVFGSDAPKGAWRRLGERLGKLFPAGQKAWVFPCGGTESRVEIHELEAAVGGAARVVVLAAPSEQRVPRNGRSGG